MKFFKLLFILLQVFILIIETGCKRYTYKENNINDKLYFLNEKKNKLNPVILWSAYINNTSNCNKEYSDLKIANNDNLIFIANSFGIVQALRIKDGKEIWFKDISTYKNYFCRHSAKLFGGITISEDLIYLSSELAYVYALNSSNGNLVWKTRVLGEAISKPTVGGDLLIVHCSNGMLQGLDKNNGLIKWTTKLNIPNITLRGESSPYIEHDIIIVGDDNGSINALSLDSGKLIWKTNIFNLKNDDEYITINNVQMTPIVYKGTIYAFSYKSNIVALNFYSGEIIWSKEIKPTGNLLFKNNKIYLIDQNEYVISLDMYTGNICWCQKKLHNLNLNLPVLYNNNIVIGDSEGYLYWIDINNGNLILRKKIDNIGFTTEPITINNNIIIRNQSNKIYSITT